jgi:hypothetical protein
MQLKLRELLVLLADCGFEHIVIGGTAAIAYGATTPTEDLDVAAPMTEDNLHKLLEALRDYHPKHATHPDLGVIPQTPAQLTRFRLLLIARISAGSTSSPRSNRSAATTGSRA